MAQLQRLTRKGILTFLAVSLNAPGQPVRVTVEASSPIRSINPWLYGINTARWDESLFPGPSDEMLSTADRDAIAKIKASGITLLKYPGGNDADYYVWNSTANDATEMDTDEYMALCREVGAEPFITVNFNESPELAAEWVRYCNIDRRYNVKLWEVGDEQWGWWAKGHAPPEEYARKYVSFVKAMKAVDSTIKVATNVPLGPHPENWTERVLKSAGDYVDMLTFTFFPQRRGTEHDDSLLVSTQKFRELFLKLRNDVERIVGAAKAKSILYVNVGYNSVDGYPGPQTLQVVNALWVADMLGTMAEVGVDIACYWALHNYYPPRGGDYGYLSSDGKNTPRYNYFVFPLLSNRFKGTVVQTKCSDSSISVYASKNGKALSILAMNKSKKRAKTLEVSLIDWTPQARGRRWILSEQKKAVELPPLSNLSERFAMQVPAYSLIIAELVSPDSVIPPRNLAPLARASASTYSTAWPNRTPVYAIDGKLYTGWYSEAWTKTEGDEPQWFRLSWPKLQTISFVRIHWGDTYATRYSVKTSQDGKNWHTVRKVAEGRGGTEELVFGPVKARHLMIDGESGLKKAGTKGVSKYSIREIEVYERPIPK